VEGVELVNDLERPVFEKFLFLAEMKMWLLEQPGVRAALMSGSGATVFAVLEERVDGKAIADRARKELDPTLWSWVGAVGSEMGDL
jgi:4-diphosphocytidyl-2-C-methyl-D-erythritol kinase